MRKNLLLISLDTLRADVAYSGKFRAIESLRGRGTSFMRTVSSSPLTPISHASVFTGLQPPAHGVRHLLREQLVSQVPTLTTVLREAGYATGAIVSCPGLNRWYGLDSGFEHYDDWIPPLHDGRDALSVVDVKLRGTALKRAPIVIQRALDWLRRDHGRPVFLFIHFFDSHWPYEPPEDVGVAVDNAYEGEVAYMDHYLGKFLEAAPDLGLGHDETLTVLFSDHGEDLAGWYPDDHAGMRGHPEENGHGALLFDVTQLVPLIICDPAAGVPGSRASSQVRLVDTMPTVLDLLDLPRPEVEGESLRGILAGEDTRDRAAYCEAFYREELAAADPQWAHLVPLQAVRLANSKIIWEHGGDAVDLYDLSLDPHEQRPLAVSGGGLESMLGSASWTYQDLGRRGRSQADPS